MPRFGASAALGRGVWRRCPAARAAAAPSVAAVSSADCGSERAALSTARGSGTEASAGAAEGSKSVEA
eukprot:1464630-Rhodomonas_salina.1